MKTATARLLALAAIFTINASSCFAEPARVSLDVKETRKSEHERADPKDYKGASGPKEETESDKLTITVVNLSPRPLEGIKLKYWIFGHELGKSEVTEVLNGEEAPSLPANGTAKIESKEAKVTFHEAGSKKTGKKVEKVKAEGQRIAGYAVKVYQGETVVAQKASSETIAAKVK